MSKAILTAASALLAAGCSFSYQVCHESKLLAAHASKDDPRSPVDLCWNASRFEDHLVRMVEDFDVPLEDVIPVHVFHDGRTAGGRCYYNRFTGSIVLRGEVEPAAFVHELSHLLAHRIVRSPPYWADQALAQYMEHRFTGSMPAGQERHLLRRIAEAEDEEEVLAHLTRVAVDEDRGWGLMMVRYLFETRWRGQEMHEKIRLLLSLREDQVEKLASSLLRHCRRGGYLVDAGDSPAY